MRTNIRKASLVIAAAGALAGAACASSSNGGGTTSDTSPTSGTGPCATGTQDECQQCVDDAAKICNQDICKATDVELQNCAVMATYYPCEDLSGVPTDCCKLQEQALVACWNTCPEMQACS